MVDPGIIEAMTWMTLLINRRPAANRHWGAPVDADMSRMAAELSVMSQDEHLAELERLDSAEDKPHFVPPYRQGMSDRFVPQLSTR